MSPGRLAALCLLLAAVAVVERGPRALSLGRSLAQIDLTLGDIVVLSRSLLDADEERLASAEASYTIVGGRIAHRRDAS